MRLFLAALEALKKKKQYEKQLQAVDGKLSTVEFQLEAVNNASTNQEVMNCMAKSATALKGLHYPL